MEKFYNNFLEENPGIGDIFRVSGSLTLKEYTREFYNYEAWSIQPREDFIQVVSAYARRLLGCKVASLLEKHLAHIPVVLTANHHGVDYKSFTVQGTILFSLPQITADAGESSPVVPVLACGLVPLSNYSFPRGISLSRKVSVSVSRDEMIRVFLKLPILPLKQAQTLVGVSQPITESMVKRTLHHLETLSRNNKLSERERDCLYSLLDQYAEEEILRLPDYSSQAVVLNHALWKKMFALSLRDRIPELVYLEMERIVSALLEKDLEDEGSLIHNLLFDQKLRNGILSALDGQFGCWDIERLERLADSIPDSRPDSEDYRGCGSVFFWGVSALGHRIPLKIRDSATGPVLTGIEPDGRISIPLTPGNIKHDLQQRRLIPNLFTSFTSLTFARGIKCVGGFFQVDYLPAMQRGLVNVLESHGPEDWAEKVAQVPTADFITGMNVVFSQYPDGTIEPAGAVEIIAAGGLTHKDLERILQLTVEEALLSGISINSPNPFIREKLKNGSLSGAGDSKKSDLREKMILLAM